MRLILIRPEHFLFGHFHSFHSSCVCVCGKNRVVRGRWAGSLSCDTDDSEGGQRKRSWSRFENCQLRILLELLLCFVFIIHYICRKNCARLRAQTKLIYKMLVSLCSCLLFLLLLLLVAIAVASAVSKCLFVQQINWIIVRASNSIYCCLRCLMVF